jgi:hypothetical protein
MNIFELFCTKAFFVELILGSYFILSYIFTEKYDPVI